MTNNTNEENRKPMVPDGALEDKLKELVMKAHKDWHADPAHYRSYYTRRICSDAPVFVGKVNNSSVSPYDSRYNSPLITHVSLKEELKDVSIVDEFGREKTDIFYRRRNNVVIDGAVEINEGNYLVYDVPGNMDLVRVYDSNLRFKGEYLPGRANKLVWAEIEEREKYEPRHEFLSDDNASPQWGGYN